MHKRIAGWAMRQGAHATIQAVQEVVPRATQHSFQRIFEVTIPLTVFVHASNARVRVRRHITPQVILDAELHASFGWQFTADQDSAGVYIVAKRKPIVGALSYAQFTLTVPAGARLLATLSGGMLQLENIDGQIDIPPLK
jgi:hypothetical protein